MSTWKITATALAIVVGFAAAADARGGNGGHERGGERMTFEALDVDGSGEITTEDLEAQRQNRFAEIDTDGNGSVSLEEFTAHASERAGERAAEMFERLDADGDGVLSQDVLQQRDGRNGKRMGRMIERFDTDGSGGVSAEEFAAAEEKMSERGDRKGHKGKKNR